ncbi:nitrate reductase molybdenum cofactor assembly chaperone [Fundidesulfovibrio terrae]|uniref:nitrate reductase molybdenum cofactor assembly chaperone n=1 Tax=Fundidesulfovibrio terrae TaxID=2922866 RepID=UPI001FAF951F|nr:nitrate reductase molybdenum cofactor assembly chaperone [Fundidesulfovibrio terrae]
MNPELAQRAAMGGQNTVLPMLDSQTRLLVRCASALLRYPDDDLRGAVRNIRALLSEMASGMVPVLERILDHMEETPMHRLQQDYARTFDLDTQASLHLSWHRYGDDPKRGRALAGLMELYRDAGYEVLPGELPDFLPLVLEFLSECPDWAAHCLMDGFGCQMRNVAAHLEKTQSPYAPVLGAALDALRVKEET